MDATATTGGTSLNHSLAEEMLRTLHEHQPGQESNEAIAGLIHPQAEMRLLVSHGELLQGRDEVLGAFGQSRESGMYLAHVRGFEWLDEQTSLTTAQARYAIESGGHAQGTVYWLDELRDGLIWRVQVFKNDAEARLAYSSRLPS